MARSRTVVPIVALVGLLLAACLSPSDAPAARADAPGDYAAAVADTVELNPLTPEEKRIILHKGTERAFSGKYHDHYEEGVYLCKQCDLPLFRSEDKFDSGTGWPSFDRAIADNVEEVPDGRYQEIVCARCGGHLGHVFRGEGFTPLNTRHCVNSLSLTFQRAKAE